MTDSKCRFCGGRGFVTDDVACRCVEEEPSEDCQCAACHAVALYDHRTDEAYDRWKDGE